MTTAVNSTALSLVDVLKVTAPDGTALPIAQLMSARSAILKDALFVEGNLTTGHTVAQQTGLPSASWRALNAGIAASKGRVNTFTETCAILSSLGQCAVELAEMYPGGPAQYRLHAAEGHIEAMWQEMEASWAYASLAAAPNELNGLIPRFNSTTAVGGSQIVLCDDAASGSDQTSVLLVGWGARKVYGFYPRGSTTGGIVHEAMPAQMLADSGGTNLLKQYVDTFDWKVGFAVEDYRYISRVANIDAVNMAAGTSPIFDAMIEAFYLNEGHKGGAKMAWYCNRAMGTYFHKKARAEASNQLTVETIDGKPVVSFLGVPIRITDGIGSAEDVVS
ncbi:MAG: major capsid protein [Candidatus Thermoplasmatota archaeon]|jgi:hypothetical protein